MGDTLVFRGKKLFFCSFVCDTRSIVEALVPESNLSFVRLSSHKSVKSPNAMLTRQ
jgi:hypothetical protein